MELFVAPLQGYTSACFRYCHAGLTGCEKTASVAYLAPFLRIERGSIQQRELKDLASPLNSNHRLIPQIIFGSEDEFRRLVDAVVSLGYRTINLNLGCPFPMQTGRGRGSAVVENPELLERVARMIEEDYPAIDFSVKMRLGWKDERGWERTVDLLNSMRLEWVAIHGRTASDMYRGEIRSESAEAFLERVKQPTVYNGDLTSLSAFESVRSRFPTLYGVMAGRGILSNPLLLNEWLEGTERTVPERKATFLQLFDMVGEQLVATCEGGDHQLLGRLKSFWDYSEPLWGRKALKKIAKSSSLAKLDEAVRELRQSLQDEVSELQYCR